MRRFLILLLAVVWYTATPAAAPADELAVVAGGEDYLGLRYIYENVGVQVGTFQEPVCARYCRGRCVAWGEADAQLYEAVGVVPIHKRWLAVGTFGFADRQDGTSAEWGIGGEYRWRHLTAGATWSSAVEWTGSVGWSANW